MEQIIKKYEIAVLGATPGGIAAALAAARMGRHVTLIETNLHVGGMAASGLGKSDIENRAMIGGIFQEFVAAIKNHYTEKYGTTSPNVKLCREGYCYEPSVAEAVFNKMLAEQKNITVMRGWRLNSAETADNRLTAIKIVSAESRKSYCVKAQVFIDATYEGDLYAAAGAEYRLGREARHEFNEPHAGVVYYDYQSHCFLKGTTGEADQCVPAYTYRLCLTTDPENSYKLILPPPDYNRNIFSGYFDDLAAGRLAGPKKIKPGRGYHPPHFNTMMRALSIARMPNNKVDANINPRPLAFPFPEENTTYVEGDYTARQRVCEKHRHLTLGLLWFLQNDPAIPLKHRQEANRFHLPLDEFKDNNHFPFQLYVREARRLLGEYTLTEHDITGSESDREVRHHNDAIAIGEFPIDSFPCRKRQPGDTVVLEGYLGMLDAFTRPYEIPYRIMIPKRIDGVIVPVAASTTHVAYSSIRMEPTWMALGQAAGVAAHTAIEHKVNPRQAPINIIRKRLRAQGQVLEHLLEKTKNDDHYICNTN